MPGKSYPKSTLRRVSSLCMKASKILMASGAETARVEATVNHIGRSCKVPVDSYATPTGITITVGEDRTITTVIRVKNRTIDLAKVIEVNNISRDLAMGKISFQSADKAVDEILHKPPLYSSEIIYLGQAICCAGFAIFIDGQLITGFPALIVGLLAKYTEKLCANLAPFLFIFINALVVTLFADICCFIFPSMEHKTIVIAGIIPLLPGLSLTNALADLMEGELLSGIARTTDSLLAAAALAAGAAVGISLGSIFT